MIPFGGVWSKWYLALGTVEGDHWILLAVLMSSSLLNVAYLLPVVVRGFFLPSKDGDGEEGVREAPLFCLAPLSLTALACLVLFFYAGWVQTLLEPIVQGGG